MLVETYIEGSREKGKKKWQDWRGNKVGELDKWSYIRREAKVGEKFLWESNSASGHDEMLTFSGQQL